MRQSQVAMLSAVGTIVLSILAATIIVRVAFPTSGSAVPLGDQTSRTFDLSGFDGVSVGGNWNVTIEQGEDWSVELSYPEGLEDRLDVRIEDGDLIVRVDSRNFGFFFREPPELTGEIVMPRLENLRASAAAGIVFSGFEGERLDIRSSAAANVEGRESRYEQLNLRASASSKADLTEVVVTDAEVRLSAAAEARLTLDDGALSGQASAGSRLTYYGTPRSLNVDTSAGASVEQGR